MGGRVRAERRATGCLRAHPRGAAWIAALAMLALATSTALLRAQDVVVPDPPAGASGPPPAVAPVDEGVSTAPLVVVDTSDSWALERFATRLSVFAQDGAGGLQSQWGTNRAGPGSELLWVLSPTIFTRIRQPGGITHDVYIPVDIITAASPDALDAISSASRDNESIDLDVYSSGRPDADTTVTVHWGGHVEEQLRAGHLGFSVARELAEDNAVLALTFDGVVDVFDPTLFNGWDPGLTERLTTSVNLSLSQLLSPTTIIAGSYGMTGQIGTLQTTYNSVPHEGGDRVSDLLPHHRMRHALSLRLAQAIPESRTYLTGNYRFYVDDFGVLAHTLDAGVTQYLGADVSLRLSYRLHTQTAASFWTPLFPAAAPFETFRTADSDLSAFDAHEGGATLRWYWDRAGALTARSSYLEAAYTHYERTNGLHVNVFSIGWGWQI
jgi:hypothetical protein